MQSKPPSSPSPASHCLAVPRGRTTVWRFARRSLRRYTDGVDTKRPEGLEFMLRRTEERRNRRDLRARALRGAVELAAHRLADAYRGQEILVCGSLGKGEIH